MSLSKTVDQEKYLSTWDSRNVNPLRPVQEWVESPPQALIEKARNLERRFFELEISNMEMSRRIAVLEHERAQLLEHCRRQAENAHLHFRLIEELKDQLRLFKRQVFQWFSLGTEGRLSESEKELGRLMRQKFLDSVDE